MKTRTNEEFTSLYLSQSYQDSWEDYQLSIKREKFPVWDYVLLTASNEHQADIFRMQLDLRKKHLPNRTRFVVLPDEQGKRVGSGGATLSVLKYIRSHEPAFNGLRILVIHSGGNSMRIPQYSALGKLFSPVPHLLPDGRASTLFDELIIVMSSLASRIEEGMLLVSGDVLPLYNPLLVDYNGKDAAVISFKEKVDIAQNHGVFLSDINKHAHVKAFLHKKPAAELQRLGAVNEQGYVDIDIGSVIFSKEILNSLYGLISVDGVYSQTLYEKYVNDTVRLSLYGDFQYPMSSSSTLEEFLQQEAEGERCEALIEARKNLWKALRPYHMKIMRVAPSKFIHFGTSKEVLDLYCSHINHYKDLFWSKQVNSSVEADAAAYHSVLSVKASIGKSCYIEVSYVQENAKIGNNSMLSYIDIHGGTRVPDHVVMHGLKQNNAKFICRIYGITDNPKKDSFFGLSLRNNICTQYQIEESAIWDASDEKNLWNAKLYPECDTIREAVDWACRIHSIATQTDAEEYVQHWLQCKRKSLKEGFADADTRAIIEWHNRMEDLVHMNNIHKQILQMKNADEQKNTLLSLSKIQKEWLSEQLKQSNFLDKMRLLYYVSVSLGAQNGDSYKVEAFKVLQQEILYHAKKNLEENTYLRIALESCEINLPLRVNWGGGWSDTPPYCFEHGGTVINAAIKLRGKKPCKVIIQKRKDNRVAFASLDMDVYKEFTDIKSLQNVGNPSDPFVLHKAALLACGVIPMQGGDLEKILQRLGGGIYINTEVVDVPKGSGLGTSSILSAACVTGLFQFFGLKYQEKDVYERVLCMEQLMSTGGGWQDQIGGMIDGIKYTQSMPGIQQKLTVSKLKLQKNTLQELNQRFCLVYTGQRRLARNILRDVIGNYIGNHPDSIYALNEIQKIAALMKFELERNHVDAFAELLNEHWKLSKMIDPGSSNTLIEQIFDSVNDLIKGKMICGAGGGGFLQVILKKHVTKTELQNRLKNIFHDSSIDVWDCELQ